METAQAVKVLYFTVVPLAKADNGGSIVCRYHLERLAACEGLELHVSTFGSVDQEIGTREFVESLGAHYHSYLPRATSPPSALARKWAPAWRWSFLYEAIEHANLDVDRQFRMLAEHLKPDIVIIDYLLSALFVRSIFSMPVRIITITLNKEAEFHAQMRRLGRLHPGVSTSIIAQWRLARFERTVYRNSDAVVVLSAGDLPADRRVRAHATVLEPILDARLDRWRFCKSQELFFVGNIVHYPNFLAVKWLAEKFAPALAVRCPEARIRIVGITADQAQPEWVRNNIEYMGPCDEQTLTGLFTSGLFIAPIENNFGAKMKVMQCLTHGTPMLATSGALSGIPFNDVIPRFSLNDADGAAKLAADMLGNEKRLLDLSHTLTSKHSRLLDARNDAWLRFVTNVRARPLRSVSRASMFSPLRRSRSVARASMFSPLRRIWNYPVDTSLPWPRKLEIAVKEPVGVVTSGMYSVEQNKNSPLRWTGATAELEVPLCQKTLPTTLMLRLWDISPPCGTKIRILVNGSELFRGRVNGKPIEQTIPLPDLKGVPILRIRVESSSFQPEGDARKLGVAIRSMVLKR